MNWRVCVSLLGLLPVCLLGYRANKATAADRPNIMWIVVEDASPHIGCYGETTIQTPRIDQLADSGIRFTNAVVTHPVCSPSRSAMVTGMYATTLGAHNHRSQRKSGKGGGNRGYYASYRLPVKSVPELFRQAGYHVTNSGRNKRGKTDYNFVAPDLYDSGDWTDRQSEQPFFAQVQLHGGKARGAQVEHPVAPEEVTLPPYYPDTPVIRRDWARYLNSWMKTDREVGQIIDSLRGAGVLEQTVVFLWADHGVSHLRGKQFLYQEGIHVPLIVRRGERLGAGSVRRDLIEQIDIAATSLALAGIKIPSYIQGQNVLADDRPPRQYAFAARDRCDETVDIIRSVQTQRWKYIRNFMSYVPHAQPNQYKDGKIIVQHIRALNQQGELTELQASLFSTPRPVEELYDLQQDPHETVNLADQQEHQHRLQSFRHALYDWMVDTRDLGLIPEPILENLGRRHGNKYFILQQPEHAALLPQLIDVVAAGEAGNRAALLAALDSQRPSVRYWAATWLGNLDDTVPAAELERLVDDPSPAVRIAASLALAKSGPNLQHVERLANHVRSSNLITGMYAIRALEQLGSPAGHVLPSIRKARDNPYEFTRRYARRLTRNLADN